MNGSMAIDRHVHGIDQLDNTEELYIWQATASQWLTDLQRRERAALQHLSFTITVLDGTRMLLIDDPNGRSILQNDLVVYVAPGCRSTNSMDSSLLNVSLQRRTPGRFFC